MCSYVSMEEESLGIEKTGQPRELTQNHQHHRCVFLNRGEYLGGQLRAPYSLSGGFCMNSLSPNPVYWGGLKKRLTPLQRALELLLLVKLSQWSPWKSNTSLTPDPLFGEKRITNVDFPRYNWHVLIWHHTTWLFFCLFRDLRLTREDRHNTGKTTKTVLVHFLSHTGRQRGQTEENNSTFTYFYSHVKSKNRLPSKMEV